MEPDAALPDPGEPADDGPMYPWLPPEDRLWRHPSEAAGAAGSAPPAAAALPPRAVAGTRRLWAVAVTAGLVGAVAASGFGIAGGLWPQRPTVIRPTFPAATAVSLADAGAPQANWTAVDDSVAPSVVGISVQGPAGPQQASGLIVATTADNRAYVITDRSVIDPVGYSGTIQVTFLSGAEARGKVVGQDRLTGLALIRVDNVDREIPAATGSVSSLHDADAVMAVAARTSPGGSVFPGSVTGQDRRVTLTDGTDRDGLIAVTLPSLPQAASGGPVLDGYGRVVGITVGLDSPDPTDQRLTFAVPVDTVTRVTDDLITGRPLTHAWLGISDAADLPSALAHRDGLVGGVQAGAVYPGSPAARAGLAAHDILTTFDGKPVESTGALVAALSASDPGRTVPITFLDGGRNVRAEVTLSPEPADAGAS